MKARKRRRTIKFTHIIFIHGNPPPPRVFHGRAARLSAVLGHISFDTRDSVARRSTLCALQIPELVCAGDGLAACAIANHLQCVASGRHERHRPARSTLIAARRQHRVAIDHWQAHRHGTILCTWARRWARSVMWEHRADRVDHGGGANEENQAERRRSYTSLTEVAPSACVRNLLARTLYSTHP